MFGNGLSVKLLNIIEGSYKPSESEIFQLAKIAKLNKLYLAFLKNVDNEVLQNRLLIEETRYKLFMKNVVDVIRALKDLRYVLYKFRKPIEHISVDLDLLIHTDDLSEAITRLKSMNFVFDVIEPYTVTLRRKHFVVDLYTYPAFAWIVYMDGQKLLTEHSEDIEIDGVLARSLTKDAEVAVVAAHAVYKEHIVLLIDCLTISKWFTRKTVEIAEEFKVRKSLEITNAICKAIKQGAIEAPYKIPLPYMIKYYVQKIIEDHYFRETLPNIGKYLTKRKHGMYMVIQRLKRRSY